MKNGRENGAKEYTVNGQGDVVEIQRVQRIERPQAKPRRTHQIVHFSGGNVLTVFNVVGVREKKDTHLLTQDGRRIGINRANVDYYEIFDDETAKRTFGEMLGEVSANEGKIK